MGRHSRNRVAPAPREASAARAVAGRHRGSRRRRHSTVRTGLLASSAALAVGAVAMGAGVLPGPAKDGRDVAAVGPNANTAFPVPPAGQPEPDGSTATPVTPPERESVPPSRGRHRGTPDPSESVTAPGTPQAPRSPAPPRTSEPADPPRTSAPPTTPPPPTTPAPTRQPETPVGNGQDKAAAAAVLGLVNAERAKAGCDPVKSDERLAELADSFSEDMAERSFFDHVTPDGLDPWERAQQAGITNLGGENIARGQTTAQAVMDSWMESEGHRANILNCEYQTLGVGVHFAEGGPWWTQDFGF
ncbi:hypothetical protein GCM10027168_55510 [Streptomyces capparidis]